MIVLPDPTDPTNELDAALYDAWGRFTEAKDSTTDHRVTVHGRDALHRRQHARAYQTNNSTTTYWHDYYFADGWRVLETRNRKASNKTLHHYAWGFGYVDDLARFSRDTNNDGAIDQHLYPLQDANWNVAALSNASGTVVERYSYSPYGQRSVLDANFAADADGASDYQNPIGHQGLYHDIFDIHLIYNRNRLYHPLLGRFLHRDPLGYVDGMSLYEYERSSSISNVDPSGSTTEIVGPMSIDYKIVDTWIDRIKKPGARFNFPWSKEKVRQEVDFRVAIESHFSLTLSFRGRTKAPGYPGDPGSPRTIDLPPIEWSLLSYVEPTAEIIGPHVRGKTLSDALTGVGCRKTVVVRQECCNYMRQPVNWSRHNHKDRFVKVDLYGRIVVPSNSLNLIAQCDVSQAEGLLSSAIDVLNSSGHNMCTEGLHEHISFESVKPRTAVEVGDVSVGWPSRLEEYSKGEHHSLLLFDPDRYVVLTPLLPE